MVHKLKLSSSSKSKPTFFKLLTHDFTRQLKLPATFVRIYGKILPKRCKLRTSSEQQTFDVRIEKTKDVKECCFTGSGWNEFVEYLGLEIGEIVIMWFDGESEFDVSVFQANGCEKETLCVKPVLVEYIGDVEPENLRNNQSEDDETEDTEVGADCDESFLRFEVVLKGWQSCKLVLPKKFAENAGLIDKKAVVLKYLPKKPYWPVLLDQRQNNHHWFQLYLGKGWSTFRVKNKLAVGKTYSFTFNPVENVIQVEPVR